MSDNVPADLEFANPAPQVHTGTSSDGFVGYREANAICVTMSCVVFVRPPFFVIWLQMGLSLFTTNIFAWRQLKQPECHARIFVRTGFARAQAKRHRHVGH